MIDYDEVYRFLEKGKHDEEVKQLLVQIDTITRRIREEFVREGHRFDEKGVKLMLIWAYITFDEYVSTSVVVDGHLTSLDDRRRYRFQTELRKLMSANVVGEDRLLSYISFTLLQILDAIHRRRAIQVSKLVNNIITYVNEL